MTNISTTREFSTSSTFSRVQIAIGPYEVKEDSLAGLKAAFEAFVYVSDQKFEFTSNKLRSLLPESQVRLFHF